MTNITRLFPQLSPEEMLEWVARVTPLWNAEFRLSFDQVTCEWVAEIVYSNSHCKRAVSQYSPSFAIQKLIQQLGGT